MRASPCNARSTRMASRVTAILAGLIGIRPLRNHWCKPSQSRHYRPVPAPNARHISGALLTSGASGHGCFLAVNQISQRMMGEYGVPDVALPNVALPIARGQRSCLTKHPQSARPLVCGHEREGNGTKQDKCRDHRQTFFSSPPTMPQSGPCDYGRKNQTETLPNLGTISSLSTT
jgi:hypothetical protein